MFARLFSMFLAVIVAVMLLVGGISYVTIRNALIDSRMSDLKNQAREIAYIASQVENTTLNRYLGLDTPIEYYLEWKVRRVYEQFGAYILVVDRNGRVKDNLYTALKDNLAFAETLNAADIRAALAKVLAGEEVQSRTNASGADGAVFTVAVPWVQNGSVTGAVFIHTSAQTVETAYRAMVLQVFVGLGAAAAAAALGAFLYTRRVTRPLRGMAAAAADMARGDFTRRAEVVGGLEIEELARAFNAMAEKLQATEAGRREFVSNVSHELRSPLTSIHGFVSGILDGTIPADQTESSLRIVDAETTRLSRLISDLLHLSRMDEDGVKLARTVFDIHEAMRQALIQRINDIDEKRLEVDVGFDSEPCFVDADRDRVYQVLVNLIDNAIKFTPEGGKLSLLTEQRDGKAVVIVQDDGVGVSPEDAPRIFDRFYKADRAHTSGKGTGLGLSICERILALHGETIRLAPSDRGARFEFTLQMAEAPRRDAREGGAEAALALAGGTDAETPRSLAEGTGADTPDTPVASETAPDTPDTASDRRDTHDGA